MKVLIISHQTELPTVDKIVKFLRSKRVDVFVEPVPSGHGNPNWSKFAKKEIITKHKEADYDFLISHTHSNIGQLKRFLDNIKPKLGFIDMEHDIYTNKPVHFKADRPNMAILTFTKRHHEFARNKLTDREVIMCRWPKLDLDYDPLKPNEVNEWYDGIYVGTLLDPSGKSMQQIKSLGKVWHKKYAKSEPIMNGSIAGPEQFIGPKGVKYCCQSCRFIFSIRSSCIPESLLFGSLPITLPNLVRTEKKINNILSEINNDGLIAKGITTNDLGNKLKLLRNDRELFDDTLNELFIHWFGEDYMELPSAHQSLLDYMNSRG